ncbi:hypothetical protein [Actinomadura rupiterrae]|uniref:hypothetical protein n=1 Tax=Actinomadura rupiterrae TaxID=559627 RepID=UPI0020A40FBD|nr:hypothetical protein [Actinomadura rupiterrae]MCP2337286.1 membrane-associated phospholipid phosphatase [Actinomadura rupiterrae]
MARAVTEVFAPWLLITGLFLGVGAKYGATGLGWGLLGALFASLGPMGFIVGGVIAGRFSDHHLTTREHRIVPLVLSLLSVGLGIVTLQMGGAPSALVAVEVSMLGGLLVMGPITAIWKISFHTGVAAAAACILMAVHGLALAGLLLLVVLIGWSRVVLSHHSVAQVVAGAPVGVLAALPAFLLVR